MTIQENSKQTEMAAMVARIAELEAALAAKNAPKERKPRAITFKVSPKGAISAYGLNVRFPVTLYVSQWNRILKATDDLRTFVELHAKELAVKDAVEVETAA